MHAYNGKNVLITGGVGFIGSTLAIRLLSIGANVTLIDNLDTKGGGNIYNINEIKDRATVKICDIRDEGTINEQILGTDILFNLAAQTGHIESMTSPKDDLSINLTAQVAILEACRKTNPKIKIVFTSTRQLYGKPNYLPVDEKHSVNPVDVNGVNKLAAEKYHLLYNKVYGINSCVLRLTNTYGPRMRIKDANQTFVGIWIRQLLENNPIQVFGDGSQLRDFNYVDDCVEAIMLAGLSNVANGKIYNLGSPEIITLEELASMMVEIYGRGQYQIVPFPAQRKAIDIGNYYADFSLIKSDLGWEPIVSLKKGIKKAISYYENNSVHYC